MGFPPEFSVRRDRTARVDRLIPADELDMASAPTFEGALNAALDDLDSDAVMVVGLRELEFIDSSGVRVLLDIAKRGPGRLRIVNGSAAVDRLFGVLGIRALLPVISADHDPLQPLPEANETADEGHESPARITAQDG